MDQNVNDTPVRHPDTALIVIGHGANDVAEGARVTLGHCARVKDLGLFAEVRVGFMLGEPSIDRVFDGLADNESIEKIVIVPNLACDGYFAGTILPRRLGLDDAANPPAGGKKTVLTPAVGEDPQMIKIATQQARALMNAHGLEKENTGLLIIGHGSGKNQESERRTREIADALVETGPAGEVACAFLEHPPRIEDWAHDTKSPNIIVIPYLMARGLHGGSDIPDLLGIEANDPALAALSPATTAAGPYALQGRKIWYCLAVGEHQSIADVIVRRAENAL